MEKRKDWQVSLFILFCILLNFAGKQLASAWGLPVWLDSMGTLLSAYACGPVCGAIVGVTVNIITAFFRPLALVYALTSIGIGLTVGICTRRKLLKNLFGILSTGFLVALVSTAISTPLNYIFFSGYTGNIWGDGAIDLLMETGRLPYILCCLIGEYCVDFPDKVFLLLLLFAVVQAYRYWQDKWDTAHAENLLFGVVCCALLLPMGTVEAKAANADFSDYIQTVYDASSGLTGGTANDIAQTKDGILWIGTCGGLYRYNGSQFQWMSQFETVKNVNCLYTDSEGRLWIGTNDKGLSICIGQEVSNTINMDNGLPSNSVRCITQSADGKYFVGMTDSLAIVTIRAGISVSAVLPKLSGAVSLSADDTGIVAVVSSTGELSLLHETNILYRETCPTEGAAFSCCLFGKSGDLYAGTTGNQIEVYSVRAGQLVWKRSIPCGELANLRSLTLSEDGHVMICANNGAGYVDTAGICRKISTGDFDNSLEHMLFDYQGNLWFTSSRLGLMKLCRSAFTELYQKTGLPEEVVNTVTQWQGALYFGTDSGLDKLKADTPQEDELTRQLDGVRIRCLMVDSKEQLWACTSGKGVLCVPPDGKVQAFDSKNGANGDNFCQALELVDGSVAAAGDFGVTFLRDGRITGTVGTEEGLKNPKVLCLLQLPDGRLLAGTDGNGIAVIQDGQVVENLKQAEGLSSEVIMRMVADPDGEGAFVVTSNGLCYLESNGQARFLQKFPYYSDYDVTPRADGKLFVSSSAGIYVVDRAALKRGDELSYELLDATKGLVHSLTPNAWNYLDEFGNLYLACDQGVFRVNLNAYEDTSFKSYRMQLETVLVDGTAYSVQPGETLSIPRGANRVEIVPEVINYSLSEPYISVYLDGVDAEPRVSHLSEFTSAVYTNLATGYYTFRLAVQDKPGVNMAESVYMIKKEAEIYDYWWFKAYISFVATLTIAYLTWLIFSTQFQRTLALQKKELELAQRQVEMSNEAILTIARTVDAKDSNTSQHSIRVAEYAVLIGQRLGYGQAALDELRKTALLHDIGKIGIPDKVLNKPARLTDEEYAIMKSHVVKGAEILESFTSVKNISDGALYHHERYDGTGYVNGLSGEEIPLNARIIGIADAFDAMTANRVYRKKLDLDYVLGELRRGRGKQFDPRLLDVFLGLIEDRSIHVDELYQESDRDTEEGG